MGGEKRPDRPLEVHLVRAALDPVRRELAEVAAK
jgi:hypothetical protein